MRPFRNLKIASVIEHELSQILARDYHVDGALITVTGVEVSEDLVQAKVNLSVVPYAKGPEAYALIDGEKKEIGHLLLKKMRLRTIPHLKFFIDEYKESEELEKAA